MNKPLEQPFNYLLRKQNIQGETYGQGETFEEDVVKNWYRARAFVLDRFQHISITPDDGKHLHVIVQGDTPLMLSIVRQVALTAHFANFIEETGSNRTIVSIIRSGDKDIIKELRKEEFLCHLLDYCKYTVGKNIVNADSYIDIEFVVLDEKPKIDTETEIEMTIKEDDVISFCNSKKEDELYAIDTSKAQYADRMYCLGAEIDNVPYYDIHSVERYSLALDVFLFSKMEKKLGKIVDAEKWKRKDYQTRVLLAISTIICSDCFITRYNSIRPYWKDGKMTEKQAWENYYDALSKSEHSRWVVEKLVLGFKPLNNSQRLEDEGNIKNRDKKKQFRKRLKNEWKSPAHIDLCSFSELRRVDPDNMKYDSFIMLGIPEILRKVGEIPK